MLRVSVLSTAMVVMVMSYPIILGIELFYDCKIASASLSINLPVLFMTKTP